MWYFELGNFSFNSYVCYLTRGFIASTRAFNLLTRAFDLPTRTFSLPTRAFSLLTREFDFATHWFELDCRFELVNRGFELVTRRLELVTRNSCFTFPHQMNGSTYKYYLIILTRGDSNQIHIKNLLIKNSLKRSACQKLM